MRVVVAVVVAGCGPVGHGVCDWQTGGPVGEYYASSVPPVIAPVFKCGGYWRCEDGTMHANGRSYDADGVIDYGDPVEAARADEELDEWERLWCDRCDLVGEVPFGMDDPTDRCVSLGSW
jgi:hypothetical protein